MKFSISSIVLLDKTLKESINVISKENFHCWEIVCEGSHTLNSENIKFLEEVKEQYNVDIVTHAPFSDLNPATMNIKVKKLTIECIREAIIGTAQLDGKVVTVHPGYIPPLWSSLPEKIIENNYNTLIEIVNIGEEHNITIGLENMPNYPGVLGTTPNALKEIIKDINSKYLGITYDIGHSNTSTNGNSEEAHHHIKQLNKIGKGIVHVHCHDNNKKDDEHLAVGSGTINFEKVIKELKNINYNNYISFESKNLEDALKSREYIEKLL